MNLIRFINAQRQWSERTFGPNPRTEGVLKHIEKEVQEVRANPTDLSEWADIIILALDGAWRTGSTAEDICFALQDKQARNFTRTYPRTADDVPSEHIEETE